MFILNPLLIIGVMKKNGISRRTFVSTTTVAVLGTSVIGIKNLYGSYSNFKSQKDIVSIVRVNNGNIEGAVEEAIDLLGGINAVTKGKNSILLKPNLVAPGKDFTTKPEVVKAIAQIMQKAGKKVLIGEGSAAAPSFNMIGEEICRTNKREILDGMQKFVFDNLGYTELAASLNIPLINLHSGDIVEVPLSNGLAAKSVKIHKTLVDVDLVCSVPMMKTHSLATVTLAMKNLIGLYPGTEYYSARSWLHDRAAEKGSYGVAYEILDMNHAVTTGLSIIDATTAMEGNGPSSGTLVDMGLIVAGTSPLATDMVGATLMGFEFSDIPFLRLAHETGMHPNQMEDIEVRGLNIAECKRQFVKPTISKWTDINKWWGVKEI
jgi:uncharacterized protein (DUF362 family)